MIDGLREQNNRQNTLFSDLHCHFVKLPTRAIESNCVAIFTVPVNNSRCATNSRIGVPSFEMTFSPPGTWFAEDMSRFNSC